MDIPERTVVLAPDNHCVTFSVQRNARIADITGVIKFDQFGCSPTALCIVAIRLHAPAHAIVLAPHGYTVAGGIEGDAWPGRITRIHSFDQHRRTV